MITGRTVGSDRGWRARSRAHECKLRALEQLLGATIGVAAGGQVSVWDLDQVLEAPEERPLAGVDVLHEQVAPAGTQQAVHLLQHERRVRSRAQDVGGDDRVEGRILERERLGAGANQLRRSAAQALLGQPGLEVSDHVRARLGDDQLGHLPRVMRQVDPAARPELECATGGSRDQFPARLALSSVLGQRQQARVVQREQALVQSPRVAHGREPNSRRGPARTHSNARYLPRDRTQRARWTAREL